MCTKFKKCNKESERKTDCSNNFVIGSIILRRKRRRHLEKIKKNLRKEKVIALKCARDLIQMGKPSRIILSLMKDERKCVHPLNDTFVQGQKAKR
jgi:hypothetical protein